MKLHESFFWIGVFLVLIGALLLSTLFPVGLVCGIIGIILIVKYLAVK